ncbi:outer membrane biogenesis protein BamB [Roseimaritima multifibrata]|uniref:Outer membrane biogenesis protein BamB n=2 Tax=Roseimaritima multifibrata TaxID=1930274 RepID=A0A517MFC0_9BACT|nr:outer membrane biogenesis protein BamB [Roseimaritima multifibrata]
MVCLLVDRPGWGQAGSQPNRAEPQNKVSDSDWPQFLGPHGNGHSDATGIRTDWSDGNLKTLWHQPLGTGYGIGSEADGKYYQFDREADQERLRCFDAASGKLIWSESQPVVYRDMYGYNNGPRSSPVIADGSVFTFGVAGQLTCRDEQSGAVSWTVDTNKKYGVIQNFFGVSCSPIVFEDSVIVMVGGSPPEDQQIAMGALDRVSPNGSAIVAFDVKTGEEKWRAGNYLASYSTPLVVELQGEQVLLAFVREGLLAIDPSTGNNRWFHPWRSPRLESVNAALPVVKGNQILISECYDIGSVFLNATTDEAEVVWADNPRSRDKNFRAHWSTPVVIDGALYGCSGRNAPDSDFRCIDFETGTVHWVDRRRTRSSVLAIDGHLVVLDEGGRMQLVKANREALEVVTEIDLGIGAPDRPALQPPCWAAPIYANGRLYVRGRDNVICLQLGK